MTKIGRTVARQMMSTVRDLGKNREVIVKIKYPNLLTFRLKGMRQEYFLTAEGCYMRALQNEVLRKRLEKAREKKNRRRA